MLTLVKAPSVPIHLSAIIATGPTGIPRFWATIWIDVLKGELALSTRRRHLTAIERFYEAVSRQHGSDCLDHLIASANVDALEQCLTGFLTQVRNEAAVRGTESMSGWFTALHFATDMLRHASAASGVDAARIEARLFRLHAMYRQLSRRRPTKQRVVRALPASVLEELYDIFDPRSRRNPFRTEELRWRNLLIFMLLLRLGLRRGEVALLRANSFKEEFDTTLGEATTWIDVEGTRDGDPRFERPSLKTALARRQLPLPADVHRLANIYLQNYRGRANYPHLLISQKSRPISLRSLNEVFEIVSAGLSRTAREALARQKADAISCHDLRHTCAVARMYRYQRAGVDLERAQEKLRVFFGWTRESQMPRLYARAYFETVGAEVWNEKFDHFIEALKQTVPERSR